MVRVVDATVQSSADSFASDLVDGFKDGTTQIFLELGRKVTEQY